MPPEQFDLEDYLEQVKRRWQSSLLSDEQNQKIRDKWDERNKTTPGSDIPAETD